MHYNISRERFDALTTVFESFNANFVELQGVFKEVTGEDFVPGQRFHPTNIIKNNEVVHFFNEEKEEVSWVEKQKVVSFVLSYFYCYIVDHRIVVSRADGKDLEASVMEPWKP